MNVVFFYIRKCESHVKKKGRNLFFLFPFFRNFFRTRDSNFGFADAVTVIISYITSLLPIDVFSLCFPDRIYQKVGFFCYSLLICCPSLQHLSDSISRLNKLKYAFNGSFVQIFPLKGVKKMSCMWVLKVFFSR